MAREQACHPTRPARLVASAVSCCTPLHHLLPLPRLLSRYDGLPTSWLLTLTLTLNLLEDLPLTALSITHLALRRGHPHTISVVALGFSLLALWCDALTPRLVTP